MDEFSVSNETQSGTVGRCALCERSSEAGRAEGAPELTPLVTGIRDYEYGVEWRSELHACVRCGLVVQVPRVAPADIPKLYPSNYLAHSGQSRGRGVYGFLKRVLAETGTRTVTHYVPKGGRMIEIGCGNGGFLKVLQRLRPDIQLSGIDIEDVGITDIVGFTFYHGQLEEVEIPAQSFDAVYCSNLIEHVPDPLLFLRKCHRILKPGGVIVGVTPDHLSVDRYVFGRYWAGYHYPRHTFLFNHHNIRQFLRASGFEISKIKGSYAFWYLSLANCFVGLPGTKKRGLPFAAVTGLFAPLDFFINLFRCHGSMTFVGRRTD